MLDAGAFIAVERDDRRVLRHLAHGEQQDLSVRTHAMVLAQVWRGGTGSQVAVALVLSSVEVMPIDGDLGREAGLLLGAAGSSDPVDAALVLLSEDGDRILTSDPDDLRQLAAAAGRRVEIVAV